MNYTLEIACFEITSAQIALNSLADRIEFCAERNVGGLTPNIDEFRYLKSISTKPIRVMLRPKEGSFLYNLIEFEQMKKDLLQFKASGADGFVFGILNEGNHIDREKNKELIELAGHLPCTFHRAVDRTPDLDQAFTQLIELGFSTVLTSGGTSSAMEGRDRLKQLVESYEENIEILVGGEVRSDNVELLKLHTGAKSFHSSAIPTYETYVNDDEIKKLKKYL
ncbi:copper homeostasis protein CutC [Chryseobacterium sp. A301]